MKPQILMIVTVALAAAALAPTAEARVKRYDFPGVAERVVDAEGRAVEGVRFDFQIKLHERKFWGWALFPPVELLACGLGQALGGVIGGWFGGGGNAPRKTCWQIWAEDLGLKAIDEVSQWDYPVTDSTGVVQYTARPIFVASPVHSFTPGLVIQAKQLEVPFDYSSDVTPSTQLVCAKRFNEPTCSIAVPGKKRIAQASKDGLSCVVPMTGEQLAAFRAQAIEQCRARVVQAEAFYHGSYPAEFGKLVYADSL